MRKVILDRFPTDILFFLPAKKTAKRKQEKQRSIIQLRGNFILEMRYPSNGLLSCGPVQFQSMSFLGLCNALSSWCPMPAFAYKQRVCICVCVWLTPYRYLNSPKLGFNKQSVTAGEEQSPSHG